MWIFAGGGTAAPRCTPTRVELAKGEPRVSRDQGLCQGRAVALQLGAGFAHAAQLLEQSHLCAATGTEGKDGNLAPVLGWAEVPPAEKPVGCAAAPGAPGLARTAHSKTALSAGGATLASQEVIAWPEATGHAAFWS